jgi:hypothetical protein
MEKQADGIGAHCSNSFILFKPSVFSSFLFLRTPCYMHSTPAQFLLICCGSHLRISFFPAMNSAPGQTSIIHQLILSVTCFLKT